MNGLAVAGADNTARDYYLAEVIYGPNAFVEVAYGFTDFEDAMRRKLVRELSSQIIGRAQAQAEAEG